MYACIVLTLSSKTAGAAKASADRFPCHRTINSAKQKHNKKKEERQNQGAGAPEMNRPT